MDAAMDRKRVRGFLKAAGRKLVNGDGEEVLLVGVGLGNWFVPEGYMWRFGGSHDRPSRIVEIVRHLTGESYADSFWKRFHETYVTRRDIEMIATMGFNSIRIPLHWRILLADGPELEFLEDGFRLIDQCLDWCEEFGIYAVLDLHAAPGGQTGWNMDDSFDDIPRLFIDPESRQRAIALWKEIARRYRNRWIVAAYDLLNEPLRSSRPPKPDTEYLHPELVRFYDDCIAAIRRIDDRHAISLEGANWASRPDTFYKRYDSNMILHFHRYGDPPGEECYNDWLALSERLAAPVWLGESGENSLEWCSAMFPLATRLGIGFNFWTWKKLMKSGPAPLLIKTPAGWDKVTGFTHGGPRPTYAEARRTFDEYLENARAGNCEVDEAIVDAIFRRRSARLMATDFDPGPQGCSALRPRGNIYPFRRACGMGIKPRKGMVYAHGPGFDSGWDKLCLDLTPGEWAQYTLHDVQGALRVELSGETESAASLAVTLADGRSIGHVNVNGAFADSDAGTVPVRGDVVVRVTCRSGSVDLYRVTLRGDGKTG